MVYTLALLLVLPLVQCQGTNDCTNESCLYPPGCRRVIIDPVGVDPYKSPFFGTMFSNVTGIVNYDNACSMFYKVGPSAYLLVTSVVFKDGSYTVMNNLLGNITGFPGAYRVEQNVPTLGCGCVYNDYTLKVLQDECNGVYFTYRCYIDGACAKLYSGQVILYAFSSALVPSPVPSTCGPKIVELAKQQGLACLPPVYLPNKLHRKCVIRVNGMTAINAQFIDPEDAVEIDDSGCYN